MKRAASGLRISFLDDALDPLARYRLIASCDAYVSLHRAEGFGLGMAEAMALGKPVIATGWSGNLEFMNPWNSFLVDFSLATLDEDAGAYPKGSVWAVPNLDDAARNLRLVWQNPELRAQKGARAKQDIPSGFRPEVVGRRIRDRLRVIEHLQIRERMDPIPTAKSAPQTGQNPKAGRLQRAFEILQAEGIDGLRRRLGRR